MQLAELEIRHSRPIAPTRRVALGRLWLPTDGSPGHGPLLLAGIAASYINLVDEDLRSEVDQLLDDMELGQRLTQPRLRHRFQTDVVGLIRSRHELVANGDGISLELDNRGTPAVQVLGALYAANKLSYVIRPSAFELIRRAITWNPQAFEVEDSEALLRWLIGNESGYHLADESAQAERWAMDILGFQPGEDLQRVEVIQKFRDLVREAHPDHGASQVGAGKRISELSRAKRILIS